MLSPSYSISPKDLWNANRDTRRAVRHWPAITILDCSNAVSWFTMLCSPGSALLPRNDITGRAKPRSKHGNH
jgi:hypothetical protein